MTIDPKCNEALETLAGLLTPIPALPDPATAFLESFDRLGALLNRPGAPGFNDYDWSPPEPPAWARTLTDAQIHMAAHHLVAIPSADFHGLPADVQDACRVLVGCALDLQDGTADQAAKTERNK